VCGGSLDSSEIQLYEVTPVNDWMKNVLKGAWTENRAGGCSNHKNSWKQNPLYRLELTQPDLIKIVLEVHDDIQSAAGYYLFNSEDGFALGNFISVSKFLPFNKFLYVSKDWPLEVGQYIIMPATFEPNKFGSFTIMVLSSKDLCKITAL